MEDESGTREALHVLRRKLNGLSLQLEVARMAVENTGDAGAGRAIGRCATELEAAIGAVEDLESALWGDRSDG